MNVNHVSIFLNNFTNYPQKLENYELNSYLYKNYIKYSENKDNYFVDFFTFSDILGQWYYKNTNEIN